MAKLSLINLLQNFNFLKEEIARLKGENERISLKAKELEGNIDAKARALANEKLKKIASEKRLLSRINLQVSDANSKLKEKIEELDKQITG
jgi:predicted nuclease with TOPRIM domain